MPAVMNGAIALLSDIHVTKTIFSIRPTWTWEVRKMHMYRMYGSRTTQEQLSRSNFMPTHMDVGSAENAYVHGWTVVG